MTGEERYAIDLTPCPHCGADWHDAPEVGRGAIELIHRDSCPELGLVVPDGPAVQPSGLAIIVGTMLGVLAVVIAATIGMGWWK
ncbi:MAG: hypothetical protein EHM24_11235 [Acidobacteria bacterium]|nr:MAG: hypothetical protein EHM24_11235 [Acidobacteriota bacterium]